MNTDIFNFKNNSLTNKAISNNRRDMRKKFIKSAYPTYTNTRKSAFIRKASEGMLFTLNYQAPTYLTSLPRVKENSSLPSDSKEEFDFTDVSILKRNFKTLDLIVNDLHKNTMNTQEYTKYKGFADFEKAYDEVEKRNPRAKALRSVLTKIALHESGFNAAILNRSGAPAYGYFLFMQDGKKWNNIKEYSGLSIDEFKNNPVAQIEAAIKLADSFMKLFSKTDLDKAKSFGITESGLIGGAWLGGVGGVRKVLNGTGNPSDGHWNKDGKGSTVADYMQQYNNL